MNAENIIWITVLIFAVIIILRMKYQEGKENNFKT